MVIVFFIPLALQKAFKGLFVYIFWACRRQIQVAIMHPGPRVYDLITYVCYMQVLFGIRSCSIDR